MNYCQQQKGLNSHNLNTLSHIMILLNPAGKHMVKVNDRNIRNKCTICLKLKRYLNNSNEIFLESSIFNLEQILHSDFAIKFCTLCSNFATADFEQLDVCCFQKS